MCGVAKTCALVGLVGCLGFVGRSPEVVDDAGPFVRLEGVGPEVARWAPAEAAEKGCEGGYLNEEAPVVKGAVAKRSELREVRRARRPLWSRVKERISDRRNRRGRPAKPDSSICR